MDKATILSKMMIKPKCLEVKEGNFNLDQACEIHTNASAKDMAFLLDMAGFNGPVSEETCCDIKGYYLTVGKKFDTAPIEDWVNDEEFLLDVEAAAVSIQGKTFEGLLLGLKTLIRLQGELETVPCMVIRDYPDIPFRSVHCCVFRPDDGTDKDDTTPEDLKKSIKNAALCGYNHVFIEFWGMFPYSLDYAHWPNAYTKEELEDVISFAMDKMHIRPLPAQNLTTHAGWSRIVTRQHTVLDQRPDLADMYIPGGWCFATENPKTKAFIKLLIDELVAMFRNPPYLHCCCDKAFGFGSGEEDRTVSADILYAKHISFLNTYLSSKNVRMVMWSDMLYSSMDALYWKCDEKIADHLPKNILMNIWTHNNPGRKWQDAAFFEDKGFETVYSPFINYESIESMVYLCKERGSHGMVQTTWYCPKRALPYVIFSGVLQWCGEKATDEQIQKHAERWYK